MSCLNGKKSDRGVRGEEGKEMTTIGWIDWANYAGAVPTSWCRKKRAEKKAKLNEKEK